MEPQDFLTGEQRAHLERLARLPSMAELERRKEKALPRDNTSWPSLGGALAYKTDTQGLIDLWPERLAIESTRPDGCWCLGLGGKGRTSSLDGQRRSAEYCPCPNGALLEQYETAIAAQARALHMAARRGRIWDSAQIPARFRDIRLSTWSKTQTDANPGLVARLLQPASPEEEWPESLIKTWDQWEGSWLFHGDYGRGKTGLAVGLAWERVTHDSVSRVLFTTCPGMLTELRSTYGKSAGPSEAEVLTKYSTVELLIVDDLGAEQVKDTGWVEDRLYQIIGSRHDEMLATIFTSNRTMEDLARRIGERTVWRIVEMCGPSNIVEVKGENLREARP